MLVHDLAISKGLVLSTYPSVGVMSLPSNAIERAFVEAESRLWAYFAGDFIDRGVVPMLFTVGWDGSRLRHCGFCLLGPRPRSVDEIADVLPEAVSRLRQIAVPVGVELIGFELVMPHREAFKCVVSVLSDCSGRSWIAVAPFGGSWLGTVMWDRDEFLSGPHIDAVRRLARGIRRGR